MEVQRKKIITALERLIRETDDASAVITSRATLPGNVIRGILLSSMGFFREATQCLNMKSYSTGFCGYITWGEEEKVN